MLGSYHIRALRLLKLLALTSLYLCELNVFAHPRMSKTVKRKAKICALFAELSVFPLGLHINQELLLLGKYIPSHASMFDFLCIFAQFYSEFAFSQCLKPMASFVSLGLCYESS